MKACASACTPNKDSDAAQSPSNRTIRTSRYVQPRVTCLFNFNVQYLPAADIESKELAAANWPFDGKVYKRRPHPLRSAVALAAARPARLVGPAATDYLPDQSVHQTAREFRAMLELGRRCLQSRADGLGAAAKALRQKVFGHCLWRSGDGYRLRGADRWRSKCGRYWLCYRPC